MSTASLCCLHEWPRDDNYDKEVMRKSDILKESSALTSLHLLEKSLQEEGVPYMMLNLTSKEWQIKTPLEIPFLCIRMPESSDVGKRALPHGGTRVWTDTHSMEVNLATSMKIKISPALWHSYSTSKNLSYKIFRGCTKWHMEKGVYCNIVYKVVKHVHQGNWLKLLWFSYMLQV